MTISYEEGIRNLERNRHDLVGADLAGANLCGANLEGAKLNETVLCGTHLMYANLTDADLTGADLSGSNLFYAELRGANLKGANLEQADFSGADLSEAINISAWQLKLSIIDKETKLPEGLKGLIQESQREDKINLEISYDKMEKELSDLLSCTKLESDNLLYQVKGRLKNLIRENSLKDEVDSNNNGNRPYEVLKILSNIKSALSRPESDEKREDRWNGIFNLSAIWRHRPNQNLSGIDEKSAACVDRDSLLNAAAEYLSRPWMQMNSLDWILLDSLIYTELVACRDSVLSSLAFRKINWKGTFLGSIPNKRDKKHLLWRTVFFSLRYIVPPSVIFGIYFFGFENTALVTSGIYAIYLVFRLIMWPARFIKNRKEKKRLNKTRDLLVKIEKVYYFCKPPVINLRILREQIDKATKAGAVFDGAVYSLLDRISEKNGPTFLPYVT